MDFLKGLFFESLPIGENKEVIEEYFNCLEKLIYTKDVEIEREQFPPDDPAISGEREYRYYSADQFKELAGGHNKPTIGQDMGHTESKSSDLSSKPDDATNTQDMEHVQEYSLFGGTFDADRIGNSVRGELDSRNPRELPDN